MLLYLIWYYYWRWSANATIISLCYRISHYLTATLASRRSLTYQPCIMYRFWSAQWAVAIIRRHFSDYWSCSYYHGRNLILNYMNFEIGHYEIYLLLLPQPLYVHVQTAQRRLLPLSLRAPPCHNVFITPSRLFIFRCLILVSLILATCQYALPTQCRRQHHAAFQCACSGRFIIYSIKNCSYILDIARV